MIGKPLDLTKSPYFLQDQLGVTNISEFNDLVKCDFKLEKKHQDFLFQMFEKSMIKSCNDISRGGPIHSLITMMTPKLGFHIEHSDELSLFSEYLAGYIMIIDQDNSESIVKEAKVGGVDLLHLGSVKTGAIAINEFQPKFNSVYEVYKNNFSDKIKN